MAQMGREFWRLTDFGHIEYRPDAVCRTLESMAEQKLLLVIDAGGIAGFIGGLKSPLYANPEFTVAAELFFWVEPEHRRGGAARLLRRSFEDAARRVGCNFAAMSALEAIEPERVEKLYLADGYRRTERTYIKRL